jgi:hypothetical protein
MREHLESGQYRVICPDPTAQIQLDMVRYTFTG